MAILKSKDIAKMMAKEMQEKIGELRIELIKARVGSKKSGKGNVRDIKRTIAKLLTFRGKIQAKEVKPIQNKIKSEKAKEKK